MPLTAFEQQVWAAALEHVLPKPPSPYLTDPVLWVKDRLGEFLWSKQREIAQSVVDNRRTAVKSCHDAGKCIYSEAMLPTADGRLVKAADLVGTTFEMLAFAADGTQVVSKAWATDNGMKPVFRVVTAYGRAIIRTGNHPLFRGERTGGGSGIRSVVRSVGWTSVDQLKKGDLVLVPERLNMPQGPSALSEDETKLLGYLLGDGGTTNYVGFTQQPGMVMDEFTQIVERMGGSLRTAATNRFGVVAVGARDSNGRRGTNHVLNLVKTHGLFGKTARQKRLPDAAWAMPDERLALLLNRLFACDGYAYVRNDRGNQRAQIGITLASERMIRDIELAMLRLGITGQTRQRAIKLNGKTFDAWEWTLNRAEDMLRFIETVGMFGKEAQLATVAERARSAGRVSKWMRREVPPGYRWEVVAEVEPLGEESTVTISVEEHHTFLTTFVEHNSFIASRIASWWVDSHPPGEALVVSTAPTYQQVHAILWEEIRNAAAKAKALGSPLPGRVLLSDTWKLDDGRLVGFGRKPADSDIHGFQGHHRKFVLVILDEACGVPEQIWTAVEAITTNADCRILAIGNPDDPNTEFGKVCKPGSGWNVVQISAFDTPNFTDEEVPAALRPLLLDPEWELDKRRRWGAESPRYVSKVLGDFPEIGENVLIPPGWIEAAQHRELPPGPYSILGVDVARFGSDRTVFALRRGPVARIIGDYSTQATMETTGKVIVAVAEHAVHEVRVDGVGVGGGVVDRLVELGHDVVDMQAGAAAIDSEHYVNARAEWFWALRCRFEAGDIDIDPDDDDLAAQLGCIQYKFTSRGQIQIESKDDLRKRKLPSPDRADALMLTATAAPPIADEVIEDEEFDEFEISRY